MKLKSFALGIALNLALISTAAHADIIFQSSSLANQNVCDNMAGRWVGQGVVSAKVLGKKVTCQYKGVAVVAVKSEPYSYDVDVSMTLISGACPSEEHMVTPGSCDATTGMLTLKSSDANLSGAVSADGKSANLAGTVTLLVRGRSVTANVEKMEIQKQ